MIIYTIIKMNEVEITTDISFRTYDEAIAHLDKLAKEFGKDTVRNVTQSLYNSKTETGYILSKNTLDNSDNKIKELAIRDEKSIWQQLCKLTEEVGELSGAILSNKNAHGSGYKHISDDEVLGEFADVMLTAKSVFYRYDRFTDTALENKISQKCEKWELNQKRG